MVLYPDLSLPSIDLETSLLLALLGCIASFSAALWYWSLDRKTESYDKRLRADIENDEAFSGIQTAATTEFIATSDSNTSRMATQIKQLTGSRSGKPDKIVPVSGDTFEQRKIEMIRERCREIPGKNILDQDLVAAIRNYYAYKLALKREDVASDVVEHFQSKFESYEASERVSELGKSTTYEDVTLIETPGSERDPLNDIFLRVVEAAEEHCIRPVSNLGEKQEEIERCREFLMLTFFGLYARGIVGVELHEELDRDDCLKAYRTTIRDGDDRGYWLLPKTDCGEDEFNRLKYVGWQISEILNEYWGDKNYSGLYPNASSPKKIEYAETPFLLFRKDVGEFEGGPKHMRLKGNKRYRKKEEYRSGAS